MTTIPNLGLKHTCSSCATRFHDLGKRPATCPKCNQRVPEVVKAPMRRTRRTAGDSTIQEKSSVIITDHKPKPVKWKRGFSG